MYIIIIIINFQTSIFNKQEQKQTGGKMCVIFIYYVCMFCCSSFYSVPFDWSADASLPRFPFKGAL